MMLLNVVALSNILHTSFIQTDLYDTVHDCDHGGDCPRITDGIMQCLSNNQVVGVGEAVSHDRRLECYNRHVFSQRLPDLRQNVQQGTHEGFAAVLRNTAIRHEVISSIEDI